MDTIRTRRILAYLKAKKSCSVRELMDKFKASSATIHRDLDTLSRSEYVERVRGGVIYNEAHDARNTKIAYSERVVSRHEAKAAIAAEALGLVGEDDIVFLDSSTTVFELAARLAEAGPRRLTVVTNAIPVMNLFGKMPSEWALIGLGGNYDPQLNSVLGSATLAELSRLNITKAFVSAYGLDEKTATTNHERQAELLRQVLDIADWRYLLVDGTKIGRKGLFRIAGRETFDAIVTK
ncbi:MAG: DeoR/GlpR transcriptional regulator [Kiritimatiellae bacterium]|nr:DeoR/GlpR transcriptional regulator [Kiritimatiellia bacterium]